MLKSLIFLQGSIYLLTCSVLWAGEESAQLYTNSRKGYGFLEMNDLDQHTQTYYKTNWQYKTPGNVIGDFNGDGTDDNATLFIEQEDSNNILLSIALNREYGMQEVFFESIGAYKGIIFISPVKNSAELSTSRALDYEGFVKLEYSAIRVTYFGKGEVVYYWSNEHQEIRSIQTAD